MCTADAPTHRLEYFARAVNPGYPLQVVEDGTRAVRPPLERDRAMLRRGLEGWVGCVGCGLLLAFVPVGTAVLLASEVDPDAGPVVAKVLAGLLGGIALLAGVVTIGLFVRDRRLHARYTQEFAEARLDEPADAPPG